VIPGGQDVPLSSDLNFMPGETWSNVAVAGTGSAGSMRIYNRAGAAHVIADLAGWFTSGPSAGAVPGAPSVSAAPANAAVVVSWTAPPAGGSQLVSYTIHSSGGQTYTTAATEGTILADGLANGQAYWFAVTATNAAGSGPAGSTAPVTPMPPETVVIPVPYHAQTHSLTCEAAALSMALAHEGRDPGENALLAVMHPSMRAAWRDGSGLRWDDPYSQFVGSPDGRESNMTGYGAYWPVVAFAARTYGGDVMEAGEEISPAEIYWQVRNGHPAVAWIAYRGAGNTASNYHPGPITPYLASDGRPINFMYGEHAVTVVGVSPDSVLIDNPWWSAGQIWLPKSLFEYSYTSFNHMAVVVR
jgi:uncharacterized protein YvpB